MPSRDGRVATIPTTHGKLIVGYGWAIYGHIDESGTLSVFKGFKNFSTDSNGHITALEAAAANTYSGAPGIELPIDEELPDEIDLQEHPVHIRTKSSQAPDLFPEECLKNVTK